MATTPVPVWYFVVYVIVTVVDDDCWFLLFVIDTIVRKLQFVTRRYLPPISDAQAACIARRFPVGAIQMGHECWSNEMTVFCFTKQRFA
jgi:hypothetical protein